MASRPEIPSKPWLHQNKYFSSELSSRRMEVGVAPGLEPPSPNQYRQIRTSTDDERYRTWNQVSNTIAAQQRAASPASAWSTGSSSQVSPRSSFRHEHEIQPGSRSMTPRLQSPNTSSRKIQQLTGYEISTENLPPKKHLQLDIRTEHIVASSITTGSDSEGSVYSQPDTSAQSSEVQVPLQRPDALKRAHTLSRLQQDVAPSAEDIIVLQQILTEQQRRYEEALLHDTDSSMLPKPLIIQAKRAKKRSLLSSSPSILKSAKDSFELGLSELTSPKAKKADKAKSKARFAMHSGDTTPEEMPPSPPAKSPRRKKKDYFTGNHHPLKLPYPFLAMGKNENAITSPAEGRFGNKISDAVKNLASSGRRGSQTSRKTVTSPNSKARKGSTPDTPVSKSSFVETIQKGNEQHQEIIEKTKESVLRTAGGKRRDELKKKIVFVGIGDQSSDRRVSEWL